MVNHSTNKGVVSFAGLRAYLNPDRARVSTRPQVTVTNPRIPEQDLYGLWRLNSSRKDAVDDFFTQIREHISAITADKGDEQTVERVLKNLSGFIRAHNNVKYVGSLSLTESMLKKFDGLAEAVSMIQEVSEQMQKIALGKDDFEGISLNDQAREHIATINRMLAEIEATLEEKARS